jgi:hypothetical protein
LRWSNWLRADEATVRFLSTKLGVKTPTQ